MFDLDHWQEIAAALAKNRLRTFLTAFGVFWGIFLLVVLLGRTNRCGVIQGFSGTATSSLFVWGAHKAMRRHGRQPHRVL
jgi:putative ABC transport system permease protein